MLVLPVTLSLVTTHHSSAACDHCCFGCTPQVPKSKRIPKERLASLIDEAKEIPTMRLSAFTGGECFTLGQELDDLVARATSHGFVARAISNGYWATTLEGANRRIARIRDAGLKELNLSTGTFHGKYVPLNRIKNGVIAGIDAGLRVVMNVEICDQSEDMTALIKDPEITARLQTGRLLINRIIWMRNEGSTELSHPPGMLRFHQKNARGCKIVMNVLTVNPDQKLVACCGLHLEKIPEMHLGSVADRTLMDVIRTSPDDLLKIWIHLDGPERILMLAKFRMPELELPLNSSHPCETCLFLNKTPAIRKVISEPCKEHEKSIMTRYRHTLVVNVYNLSIREIKEENTVAEMDEVVGF